MDKSQTEEHHEAPGTENRAPGVSENQPVSGWEIDLGDFMRTQGLLKSLRLTLNNQIVVSVDDVAGGVSEAGRKYKLGDVEQANYEVTRLYSTFHQKTNQWESQARNLEQQMRSKAAKNPRSISIDAMNRMKTEQIAVRGRIRSAEIQFRRLHQGLEQIFTNLKRPPAATSQSPATSPAGFLATFQAAAPADRPAIVKEWFEIESVLTVNVRRGPEGRYKIKFDPQPPLGRLYFLTASAQVIRLQKLDQVVLLEDLETGQNMEMTLKDFVKHVDRGAWLLQPAPQRPADA
jgi:hypothetical protein